MFGLFISVGVAAAIIAEPFVERKMKKNRENYANEKRGNAESAEQREYRQRAEYNKAHLPSMELPPLSPDWDAVNGFIQETRFCQWDGGEVFCYYEYDTGRHEIPKSDFDSDTLKLIEMLISDVNWFYCNPTGEYVWEQSEILEHFLREKYPLLSDKSISRICSTYCVNSR